MTQLIADRNTPSLTGIQLVAMLVILAGEKMYAGGIAVRDYADEAQMGSDTAGLKVVGRVPLAVDNSDDGESTEVERGIYRFDNSASNPIPRSAIGKVCFVEDDNTVAGRTTNFVAAGFVHDVSSEGVWVDMRPESLAKAETMRPIALVVKTANHAITAAVAFEGRTLFNMDGNAGGAVELSCPDAVPGMKFGVFRGSATAADDVSVQAAAGDVVEGSDGECAAGKQVDNTVDAISGIVWYECFTDGVWTAIDKPVDWASFVKNDA